MKTLLLLTFVLIFKTLPASAWTLVSQDPDQQGWDTKKLTFQINRSNCPANIDEILDKAVKIWNAAPWSGLTVEIGADSTVTPASLIAGTATGVPAIVCDTNFGTTTSTSANAVAGVGFTSGTQPITYGGLILNVQPAASASITGLPLDLAAAVAAHEIGHVIGLGHSGHTEALMYFDASAKKTLSLHQDDIEAVMYLYQRNEWSGQQMLGCGSVAGGPPKSGTGQKLAALLALFLPLMTVLYLKPRKATA